MSMPAERARMTGGLLLLLGCLAMGVAWGGYTQSIAPLQLREMKDRGAIADLHARLETARAAIRDVRKLESDAQVVRAQIARLAQEIPAGPAMVWLPELVKTHFAAFGLHGGIVRMTTVLEEPDLPGFRRGYWSIGIPLPEARSSAAGSLLAVSEFEQQHPYVKVLDVAIRPDPENPQGRVALLNLSALIRQEIHSSPAVGIRAR